MVRASSSPFDPKAVTRVQKALRKNRGAIPRMALLYKLLANPVRLKILLSLSEVDKMCVGDLAKVVDLSIAATSHQLKLLKDHDWLQTESDGKLVYYRLTSPDLKEALEGDLRMFSG